jgi:anti-anti-sigma factor
MDHEFVEIGHYRVLIVNERLDFYNVSEFKKVFLEMLDGDHEYMATELKGNVNEISSSVIAVLLTGQKKISALKRKLVLVNVGEPVRNIFFLAGLSNFFTIVDNIDQLR